MEADSVQQLFPFKIWKLARFLEDLFSLPQRVSFYFNKSIIDH